MTDLRLSPILLAILAPACITAPLPAEDASSGGQQMSSGETLLLDDFEGGTTKAGQPWSASADSNNLGSTATYAVEDGGKSGKGAHFTGHLGKNVAPWPWASLSTGVAMGAKGDLSGVVAVRFWVKGDGKKYRLALAREAVTDYANFAKPFQAPKEWTQIEIPLSQLRQADWGKKVDRAWNDVKSIEFAPLDAEQDYDVRIDNVEFVMAKGGAPPFGENAKVIDEPQTALEGTTFVLDQFEGQAPANGAVWGSEMDMNNLGTIAVARAEDTASVQKMAMHLTGKLGKNGPPWPWATLAVNLEPNASPVDLTNVKGIRFKAKGDGKPYKVAFTRKAVTDYGNFAYSFSPGKDWKQYSVPMSKFKQPDWAKQVEPGWKDATSLQFQPTIGEAPFDLWVDDVEFVYENGKAITLKK
ncbi:MAG TPA: CIA30 family protein [Polyangiaceae bacterium]|nr:CIA30 family protein [Polyangiaceae bacterium]